MKTRRNDKSRKFSYLLDKETINLWRIGKKQRFGQGMASGEGVTRKISMNLKGLFADSSGAILGWWESIFNKRRINLLPLAERGSIIFLQLLLLNCLQLNIIFMSETHFGITYFSFLQSCPSHGNRAQGKPNYWILELFLHHLEKRNPLSYGIASCKKDVSLQMLWPTLELRQYREKQKYAMKNGRDEAWCYLSTRIQPCLPSIWLFHYASQLFLFCLSPFELEDWFINERILMQSTSYVSFNFRLYLHCTY